MKYSVIVPVDLALRPLDILKKVKLILQRASDDAQIVFGHNDRGGFFDKRLRSLTQNKPNVKLISGPFYTGIVSQALLRNRAFAHCACEFIYLMDVDCLLDNALNEFCLKALKSGEKPFIILPCLYLSPKGSRQILRKSTEEAFGEYVLGRKDLFLSLALPSACIFMRRDDYEKLGGFDENFVGRGGEDFEFMLRLALFHGAIKPSRDLAQNVLYNAPLLSQGFRKYLALLALPHFFEKRVAFHIHHGRNRLRGYFRRYKKNAKILEDKIKFQDEDLPSQGESLLALYEKLCAQYELSLDAYSVLFERQRAGIFSLERLWLFLRRL